MQQIVIWKQHIKFQLFNFSSILRFARPSNIQGTELQYPKISALHSNKTDPTSCTKQPVSYIKAVLKAQQLCSAQQTPERQQPPEGLIFADLSARTLETGLQLPFNSCVLCPALLQEKQDTVKTVAVFHCDSYDTLKITC